MKIKILALFLMLGVSNVYSLGEFNTTTYSLIKEIKSSTYNEIYLEENHNCTGSTVDRYDFESGDSAKLSLLMMAFIAQKPVRIEYDCDAVTKHPKITKVRVRR